MKEIKLTKGKFALVDDKDYDLVNQYSWYAYKCGHNWYAARRVLNKVVLMHRLILEYPKQLIDHKDRNGLNNTKGNLRITTKSVNALNTTRTRPDNSSGTRGVSFYKRHKNWRAYIKINKEYFHSYHKTKEEAIAWRKRMELKCL